MSHHLVEKVSALAHEAGVTKVRLDEHRREIEHLERQLEQAREECGRYHEELNDLRKKMGMGNRGED